MRSFLPLITLLAVLQAVSAGAQTTLDDLRGSDEPGGAQESADPSDQATQAADRNPTQADVFSLRSTLNSATAETGSSGLGTNGRTSPVRPFADRIAAVDRAVPLSNSGIDDSVFGGDTTFDAAQGIRLGSFTLTPQLTLSTGWTDNRSQAADGTSGKFYRISPDISLTSNWSRHQLDTSLRGSYTGYPGDTDDNEANVFAAANLRLDISEATQVITRLTYSLSQEDDGSAESSSGTDYDHELSGSLSGTRAIGIVAATASLGRSPIRWTQGAWSRSVPCRRCGSYPITRALVRTCVRRADSMVEGTVSLPLTWLKTDRCSTRTTSPDNILDKVE